MKSIYRNFSRIPSPANSCFSGANTKKGYVGTFGNYINEDTLTRLFIFKGGPGTGKSTRMKKLGSLAESSDCDVRYLYCGSDPGSLDGVLITLDGRSVAYLDGTSPHLTDPVYPGTVSEIIDLGRFRNDALLTPFRREITEATKAKSDAYRRAYRSLMLADSVDAELQQYIRPAFLSEKARAFFKRTLPKHAEVGAEQTVYAHGITMSGAVLLEGALAKTDECLTAVGHSDCQAIFLSELAEYCRESRTAAAVYPSPVDLSSPLAVKVGDIMFAQDGDMSEAETDKVNMDRFFDRRALSTTKFKRRLLGNIRDALFQDALVSLDEARTHHFALEKIYGSAMDYGELEEYDNILADRLTELLGCK